MVRRLRLVCLTAFLALSACKGNGKSEDKKDDGTQPASGSQVQDDSNAKAAEDLLARRDALQKSRTAMQEEKDKLEAERQKIVDSGGDTADIDKKLADQKSQEEQLSSQEGEISDQMQAFLVAAKDVKISGDAQQLVAAREDRVAQREAAFKDREEKIAAREAALAQREKDLAEREKNTCTGGGGGTTIITTVDPKAKYSKHDVEGALKSAREEMAKKGILSADLPAQAASLEHDATKSLGEGDYGPARFAAAQLVATVQSIKIDRNFISSKIGRLSKEMQGRKLDDAKQKDVEELFSDATAKYGDGDYGAANKKLNAIYKAIE